ncbi:MmgE/PrpD family protein [Desertibaculum subflavum]|uniref:MmgE/PrpD family protein n=1 Tax=Desertibaculum subflavum TaxID=2268458 RepID=UPI0013C480D2
MAILRAVKPAVHDRAVTREIVERALAIRTDAVPVDVRQVAKQCILDWFAVSLAGAEEPLARMLLDQAAEDGGHAQAGIVGHRLRVSTRQAALINGSISHALDYDDVNFAMGGHPTVAALPGALALAEARKLSGDALLAAFIAGYETLCRVGRLVAPGHYSRGFHATATVGSFGSAAACAHILGLDAEATARALGIAGTQAAGLKSQFGTMCKPLHAGKAAENGLVGAQLAARGFTSRLDILECVQGFADTQSPDFNPEAALEQPRMGWHVRANLFKYHAACYLTHAPMDAARALRVEHGLKPSDLRKVTVRIDSGADKVCNIQAPRTGLEAKFSLRLTTAMALAGTDTAAPGTYNDTTAADRELVQLRERVQIELVNDWPHSQADVVLELNDGRRLEKTCDTGIPAADVAFQGDRVRAKFMSLAAPALGQAGAERLAAAVEDIESLKDAGELMALAVPK